MAPTLEERRRLFDPAVLNRVGKLPLLARKPMLGSVAGKHKSPHRGSSVEFAEYRKYVPGDDLRRLDWRAYGRSDRFYIKEFEADTNLRLVCVVDGSGSMRYGRRGESDRTKYEYAAGLASGLCEVALRQGDAAGLALAMAGGTTFLPARRKASHLSAMQSVLLDTEPKGETRLVDTLHEVAERVSQRALIVVLSDLFCPPGELQEAFQHLRYRKHDVVAWQLMERDELEFRFERTTRFVDLEGGASIVADPASIGDRYLRALDDYRAELDEAVRRADVDYDLVRIEEPQADVLARFLIRRAAKGGQA